MGNEQKENEYVDFVVTARKYKTLLTEKYKNREVWKKRPSGEVLSDLPGTVIEVKVKIGQTVEEGELLMIHEAMKMLNRILSPVSGVVTELGVAVGDKISKNHFMIRIEPK